MLDSESLRFSWQPRLGQAYLSPRAAFFVRLLAFDPPPPLIWLNSRILHADSKVSLHLKAIIGQQKDTMLTLNYYTHRYQA